jgi:hypothetical protein
MDATGMESPADVVARSLAGGVSADAHSERSRMWPRCELGSTHFELGASSDYRPTTVVAKRYTPKWGVRKE